MNKHDYIREQLNEKLDTEVLYETLKDKCLLSFMTWLKTTKPDTFDDIVAQNDYSVYKREWVAEHKNGGEYYRKHTDKYKDSECGDKCVFFYSCDDCAVCLVDAVDHREDVTGCDKYSELHGELYAFCEKVLYSR